MVRRKPPKTLQETCHFFMLKYLHQQVCLWLRTLKRPNKGETLIELIEPVRSFLADNLTRNVCNDLMKAACLYFKKNKLKLGDIVTLAILFNSGTEELILDAVYSKRRKWTLAEEMVMLDSMKNSQHLTHLIIPAKCTDQVLKILGQSARNLKHLDATFSKITDKGLYALCGIKCIVDDSDDDDQSLEEQNISAAELVHENIFFIGRQRYVKVGEGCSCLKVIDLFYTQRIPNVREGVTVQGVTTLLVCLPSLNVVNYEHLGEVLEDYLYQSGGTQFTPKLNLIKHNDLYPTASSINAAISLCPNIERLELWTMELREHGTISFVPKFDKLTHLYLMFYSFTDELKSCLLNCGVRLQNLGLVNFEQIKHSDVMLVKRSCPNLHVLELDGMNFVDDDDFLSDMSHNLVELKQFTLGGPIRNERIFNYMLRKCSNIEVIVIKLYDSPVFFDDMSVLKLTKQEFPCLRGLFIESQWITEASLDHIIKNCPNITDIGIYGEWNIQKREVEHFREVLAAQNIDVTVHLLYAGEDDDYFE